MVPDSYLFYTCRLTASICRQPTQAELLTWPAAHARVIAGEVISGGDFMTEDRLAAALGRGRENVRKRSWAEAMEALEEAIRISPQCVEAWYEKGKLLNRLGRVEEALGAFEEVTAINPEDNDGWYQRGVCLTKLGRNQESMQAFREARRLNPEVTEELRREELDFLGMLGRGMDGEDEWRAGYAVGSEVCYINKDFDYGFDLDFTWDEGSVECLRVKELSPAQVEVSSGKYPQCMVLIESSRRLQCDYPARELAADLAAEASHVDSARFFVFPNGQLPAFDIRRNHESGEEEWCVIIVNDQFVYRLTGGLPENDARARDFAGRIPLNFRPSGI